MLSHNIAKLRGRRQTGGPLVIAGQGKRRAFPGLIIEGKSPDRPKYMKLEPVSPAARRRRPHRPSASGADILGQPQQDQAMPLAQCPLTRASHVDANASARTQCICFHSTDCCVSARAAMLLSKCRLRPLRKSAVRPANRGPATVGVVSDGGNAVFRISKGGRAHLRQGPKSFCSSDHAATHRSVAA